MDKQEPNEKCGECDFFIGLKTASGTSGCSLDGSKVTHRNDKPCEEFKQNWMAAEARMRLGGGR